MVALLIYLAQVGDTERLLTLHDATVAGVLLCGIVFVTVAFLRGWVVTGWQYRKVCQDAEKWSALAWQAATAARSGVQTAHEAARTLRVITEQAAPAGPTAAEPPPPMGPYGGAG